MHVCMHADGHFRLVRGVRIRLMRTLSMSRNACTTRNVQERERERACVRMYVCIVITYTRNICICVHFSSLIPIPLRESDKSFEHCRIYYVTSELKCSWAKWTQSEHVAMNP